MKFLVAKRVLCSLILTPQLTTAIKQCPFLGPDFPSPKSLQNSTIFQTALTNLTSTLKSGLQTAQFFPNTTSLSVNIFSTHTNTSLYNYQYSAPTLLTSNGTHVVDADSIFRIGSVSKLLTVYVFLIEAGDRYFNHPITDFVPELAEVVQVQDAAANAADVVDWRAVTVGNLASQMGGIARDYTGDLLSVLGKFPAGSGIPQLNASDFVICAQPGFCTREGQFLTSLNTRYTYKPPATKYYPWNHPQLTPPEFFLTLTHQRHPVFAPSTTPIYSNTAFQLLGYALENITSTPFTTLLTRSLITPLNLTGTSYQLPLSVPRGVIPSPDPSTAWGLPGNDYNPAGGFYSTANDLAVIGRSILSSKLIPAPMTRRWMKPLTHTADLRFSVGAPWEIERISLPAPQEKVVDIYGKSGDLGSYHASFAVIPDWDVGYSIIIADAPGKPSVLNHAVRTLVNELVLPSVEEAARIEANEKYAGTYRSETLNSSITLVTNPGSLGLVVTSLISNGTDMFGIFGLLRGNLPASSISMTLYPTGLTNSVGGRKEAWRAAIENNGENQGTGILTCSTWATGDSPIIGGVAADEFAFVMGVDGKATSVESRGLRGSMLRVV
ncbi:beta-lactamase/transpeptidase-like protein [Glarea lozoyensis ATCC 20868]|uniref:Beta-lactamase/transpeptidase-like protein n=1 Tax=Glarea lozoyensis (strain ATCC 20868 / MF5171) TaxID=1116229 RepID=S3D9V4_GLAL2|nr:beta-lactamase/transpeptidase-like protein [Glarea lozoyensis ATCC 20868]EPE35242.1 beta-lactamase/transpeptidase-like protein [Glarea lozoyensis ATCC 20868]